LCRLTSKLESTALAELSNRLAPVDRAPIEMIRRLAWDDKIVVARPVLAESKRLTTKDLVEIASTKSQAHLLVIAGRDQLEESITDMLLKRGNREVFIELASNAGARLSEAGYQTLVDKAEADESLTEYLGRRLDIPLRLMRELLRRASDVVRTKILSLAPTEMQDEIRRVITDIAREAMGLPIDERDYTMAEKLVQSMEKNGKLDEAALMEFVKQRRFNEATVALAELCAVPLEKIAKLMTGLRNDALLVPCRVAGLSWPTVEAILRNRRADQKISDHVMDLARMDYARLSVETAQRSLQPHLKP
jgi:uncharacterized protein (DUF2336 family)